MADDRSQPPTSRRRLGVIVRLAIYLPLLGFFGWRASQRFSLEREASDEVFRERVATWIERPTATIMLPNGEALPMLTPEQAEAQGYVLPPSLKDPPVEGAVPPVAPVEGAVPPVAPVEGVVPPAGTPPAGTPPAGPTPPQGTNPAVPGPTPASPTPASPTPTSPTPGPAKPAEPKPAGPVPAP